MASFLILLYYPQSHILSCCYPSIQANVTQQNTSLLLYHSSPTSRDHSSSSARRTCLRSYQHSYLTPSTTFIADFPPPCYFGSYLTRSPASRTSLSCRRNYHRSRRTFYLTDTVTVWTICQYLPPLLLFHNHLKTNFNLSLSMGFRQIKGCCPPGLYIPERRHTFQIHRPFEHIYSE